MGFVLTMSASDALAKWLGDESVTASTIDPANRAGGDHEARGSSGKTYSRSAAFPTCGVLPACENEHASITDLLACPMQESADFDRTRSARPMVPTARSQEPVVLDYLAGGRCGCGPH